LRHDGRDRLRVCGDGASHNLEIFTLPYVPLMQCHWVWDHLSPSGRRCWTYIHVYPFRMALRPLCPLVLVNWSCTITESLEPGAYCNVGIYLVTIILLARDKRSVTICILSQTFNGHKPVFTNCPVTKNPSQSNSGHKISQSQFCRHNSS